MVIEFKCNSFHLHSISKMASHIDRNFVQFKYNTQENPTPNVQYMNQTCVDRFGGIGLRRALTTEDTMDKNQRDRNLLKLMQEQLELVKNNY